MRNDDETVVQMLRRFADRGDFTTCRACKELHGLGPDDDCPADALCGDALSILADRVEAEQREAVRELYARGGDAE